ncbi:MAG: hypothetical protein V8S69_05605 [Dakarella massiliensis]
MAMLADTPHEPDAVSQASADFHEGVARALSDWFLSSPARMKRICRSVLPAAAS